MIEFFFPHFLCQPINNVTYVQSITSKGMGIWCPKEPKFPLLYILEVLLSFFHVGGGLYASNKVSGIFFLFSFSIILFLSGFFWESKKLFLKSSHQQFVLIFYWLNFISFGKNLYFFMVKFIPIGKISTFWQKIYFLELT